MSRVGELQKKYPSIPREVIVKFEVVRNGVKDTDDLDKVSSWKKANAHYSYQSYDHDVTLKQLVERRPSRLKDGRMLRVGHLYMRNGLSALLKIDTKSPYEIRDIGNGRVALFEGEERVDIDIYFLEDKPRATEEPLTSKGNPVSNFVSLRRGCFAVMLLRHCEYFATGEQCKFCNLNVTQQDVSSVGMGRPITISAEETLEAYKILSSEARLVEGRLQMGGLRSPGQEEKIYFDFIERIAGGASYKPNLTAHPQVMDHKGIQRLKDAGLDCITFNLEVWDPKIHAEICPGKAKYSPHERWLEGLREAVDVFGIGNVETTLIGGLTLMPENGHRTWQESLDSLTEGARWLIKNGVVPTHSFVRIAPGSVYAPNYESLMAKRPPTEYYLEAAMAHHGAMLEYGVYPKLNRFMNCGFCCLGYSYAGELGMLALAGDIGSWMGEVVPSELNWLARFVSSVRSAAPASN